MPEYDPEETNHLPSERFVTIRRSVVREVEVDDGLEARETPVEVEVNLWVDADGAEVQSLEVVRPHGFALTDSEVEMFADIAVGARD